MIKVPLTRGQVAFVDDCDAWVLNLNWQAKYDKKTRSYYATGHKPLQHSVMISMHREIMGNPKGMDVDHINHDTLDNRRENLRVVPHHVNMQNRKLQRNNVSGYIGVSFHSGMRKWRAKLRHPNYGLSNNGLRHSEKRLGNFNTPEEAARAYDREKFRLTGSTLGLNFPEDYT